MVYSVSKIDEVDLLLILLLTIEKIQNTYVGQVTCCLVACGNTV